MKLKRQLLGLFYASALGAVLIGTVAIYHILTPAVSDFEDDAARRELARVESAFLQTFTTLYARTRDWAEMRRVDALVTGESDVVPMVPGEAPDNLRLDRVVIFAPEGRPTILRGDAAMQSSAELADLYATYAERGCYPLWGVVSLTQKNYIFAMHPVADCGAALFAIALDDQMAMELSGVTGLNFSLQPALDDSRRKSHIEALDDVTLSASFPVLDYQQRSVMRGQVMLNREIYQRGAPLFWSAVLAVIAVAFFTATLVYWFVQRRVFERLTILHQAVRRIAQGGDLQQRMRVKGKDELAELAADFNAMVDHINDAQQSLAQASERAEAANRAKSLFLANMSHEIRTPMTAILGYTELMENPSISAEDRQRYLSIIQQNGDALMALISDVLDLSRIEAGQVRVDRQPCELPTLMKDVLNSHLLRAKQKDIRLSLQYMNAVPAEVLTDAFRLRQILSNLIGNAIKFTQNGGVDVRVQWEDGLQSVLHVEIADTGIGIPEAALPNVFEPFSQVDESHTRRFGGSGLGLAIARQLSRSLGGNISVSSKVGEGSVFQLHIQTLAAESSKRVQPEQALAAEMKSQRLPAIRATGRVLVVDDNQVNRLLVMRVLSQSGFVVAEADNGLEALKCFADEDDFDLIVLDMQMPIMDGFEAAAELRTRGFTGPILALTANVMAEDRRRCLEAGCDEFLGKPIRARHLLDACVRVMNRSPISTRRA